MSKSAKNSREFEKNNRSFQNIYIFYIMKSLVSKGCGLDSII
uniref:Uncharacterized protein n=1 Tax=viral metagenome TaxID=1070528 RepID=A0A6C0IQP9_9ZZZZ